MSQIYSSLNNFNYSILTGQKRVGKTAVAYQYSKIYANNYDVIWFIDASSESEILLSYIELSSTFGLCNSDSGLNISELKELLESYLLIHQYHCLFVFDNIFMDLYNDSNVFRANTYIHLLVIKNSNDQSSNSNNMPIEINNLTSEEAVLFITNRLKADGYVKFTDNEVMRLSNIYNQSPDIINCVLSYIIYKRIGISKYLDSVERKKYQDNSELIRIKGKKEFYTIRETFRFIFNNLCEDDREIMLTVSMLNSVHIPVAMVKHFIPDKNVEKGLQLLHGYSIIHNSKNNIFIPSFYQEIIINLFELKVIIDHVHKLLFFFDNEYTEHDKYYEDMLLHLSSINKLIVSKNLVTEEYLEKVSDILIKTSDNIRFGNLSEVKVLEFLKEIDILLYAKKIHTKQQIHIKRLQALVNIDIGRFDLAKGILNDSLLLNSKNDFFARTKIYEALCICYWQEEHISEALKYIIKIIRILKRHRENIPTPIRNKQALYLLNLGYIQAHKLLSDVYRKVYSGKLDTLYPGSGEILNNISDALFELGFEEKALKNYSSLVEYYSKYFSENKFLVLDEYLNIVKVYIRKQEYHLADEQLRKVKYILMKSNKSTMDYAYLGQVYINYAILYIHKKKIEQANEFFEYAKHLAKVHEDCNWIDFSEYRLALINYCYLQELDSAKAIKDVKEFIKTLKETDKTLEWEAKRLLKTLYFERGDVLKGVLSHIKLILELFFKLGIESKRFFELTDNRKTRKRIN